MEGWNYYPPEMGAEPSARIEASSKSLRRLGEVVEMRMPLGVGGGMRISVLVCRVDQLHLADMAPLAAASVTLRRMGILGIMLMGSPVEATSMATISAREGHDIIRIPLAQSHLVCAYVEVRLVHAYRALLREHRNPGEK